MRNLTFSAGVLRHAFDQHTEWLVADSAESFYLLASEIEVAQVNGEVGIRYIDHTGFQSRRVFGFESNDEKLLLDLESGLSERVAIEFVPRVKALELKTGVEAARIESVNTLAGEFSKQFQNCKIVRAALNEHNGRFAEIIIRVGMRHIAILADVAGGLTHETLLSKAFVWLRVLSARKNRPISECWIIADKKSLSGLRGLSACLETSRAESVSVWKAATKAERKRAFEQGKYIECKKRKFSGLWSGRLPRLKLLKEKFPTGFAEELLKNSSHEIDRVFSAKGETLRFYGLPFARTRVVSGEQKIWFGTEPEKTLLNAETQGEFFELLENLKTYRRAETPNTQHEFFRMAPEAWLESKLRRNIKLLDPNLILSPIYNQFRSARDKIDLLALRSDGRLVIIELKVSPDRDMVFQSVDYWRKVESQRKRGVLSKLKLFDDKEISDRPAIIYLAAPTLGFHHDLDFLAGKLVRHIEIFRFDLAENWRREVKVLRRRRIGN
jgi:hypothetical protein